MAWLLKVATKSYVGVGENSHLKTTTLLLSLPLDMKYLDATSAKIPNTPQQFLDEGERHRELIQNKMT